MTRRDFLEKTTLASGGMALMPSMAMKFINETGLGITSVFNDKLRVHVINNATLHSGAWEGSCRTGELSNLTFEAEKTAMNRRLEKLKNELAALRLSPMVELVEPVSVHSWVEKGNPDIVMPDEQLERLAATDPQTDLYIVSCPFGGWKIAQRYKKPVAILQSAGWGIDMVPAVRRMGLPSFHVCDYEELISIMNVYFARKAINNTRILSVTNFPNRLPYGLISNMPDVGVLKTKYGVECKFMGYEEFFGVMDSVAKDRKILRKAEECADELIKKAGKNNMKRDDIINGFMFYYSTISNMSKSKSNAFTIECFELCASLQPWNRRFTPCFTNALMKDTGFPSTCEGDLNVMMAMMVLMYLSGKAVYMGNPAVDIKTNTLNIHHSVASLKMKGFDQPDTPFNIESFTKAGFGTTLRHDFNLNIGQKATVASFDPSGSRILISSGEIIGGSGMEGCGCAQKVDIKLDNGFEFRRASQDFGQHLAMVYGDYTQEIRNLGDAMKFEVVMR
jgi:hypothetical protein